MAGLRPKIADCIAAQFALLRARRLLATAPIGALTKRRAADAERRSAQSSPAAPDAQRRAEAIGRAVQWTASHGLFRPFCLVQALALQDLLARAGMPHGEIRVGVRREGTSLKAHAWVRWNGQILGDDPTHVSAFTEVDDISVLGVR
jgi:hypothetical protein